MTSRKGRFLDLTNFLKSMTEHQKKNRMDFLGASMGSHDAHQPMYKLFKLFTDACAEFGFFFKLISNSYNPV